MKKDLSAREERYVRDYLRAHAEGWLYQEMKKLEYRQGIEEMCLKLVEQFKVRYISQCATCGARRDTEQENIQNLI